MRDKLRNVSQYGVLVGVGTGLKTSEHDRCQKILIERGKGNLFGPTLC